MSTPRFGLVVVMLACVAAGCSAAESVPASPSEAEIARLVIASWDGSPRPDGKARVVVREFLGTGMLLTGSTFRESAEELRSTASAIDSRLLEAVDDFIAKTRSKERFEVLGLAADEVVVLTDTEFQTLFSLDHLIEGWNRFYDAHPGSLGTGRLSRVGLSHDGEVAVVAQSSVGGFLMGQGSFHIYILVNGEWTRSDWSIGSSWVS